MSLPTKNFSPRTFAYIMYLFLSLPNESIKPLKFYKNQLFYQQMYKKFFQTRFVLVQLSSITGLF